MKTDKKPKTTPKPEATTPASSALMADPRAWLTITKRRGWSAIEHPFDGDPEMLAVYRVGVSYKPQKIERTGTRFDGQTLHVMSMASGISRRIPDSARIPAKTCSTGSWQVDGRRASAPGRRASGARKPTCSSLPGRGSNLAVTRPRRRRQGANRSAKAIGTATR